MKTLAEWMEGIERAIPAARTAGHLDRLTEDLVNSLLAVDPAELRSQGFDGPSRMGFYRDQVLSLTHPVKATKAA